MRTLVIPDIHTRWKKAETIIKNNPHDRLILLGDYFDDFSDTPQSNADTAQFIKDLLPQNNVIVLLGNHELNYYCNRTVCHSSGFSGNKKEAINNVLTVDDWKSMHLYYMDKQSGFLFTHAGATAQRYQHPITGEFNNEKFKHDYEKLYFIEWEYEIGHARGGMCETGGIFWCDFAYEFKPIPRLKQIFGHTPDKEPRIIANDNICLDTRLNHFIIIEKDTIEIREVKHE